MPDKKMVFVSYATEDQRQGNFLKGYSLKRAGPFEYLDLPEKDLNDPKWKDRVLTRIRLSAGVIALISSDTQTSGAQKWELACAKEERKKILGVWAYPDDKASVSDVKTIVWSWDAIASFIDGL